MQSRFFFLSTECLFPLLSRRIKQDLRWHLGFFFFPSLFAVGRLVCVCVCTYVCALTVQGGTDGGMWQPVWLRWRMWDSAVGLSPPWLWPYVPLITVWLHLIMTNSILCRSHCSHSSSPKKKGEKNSNLSDKSWHLSQDVWILLCCC